MTSDENLSVCCERCTANRLSSIVWQYFGTVFAKVSVYQSVIFSLCLRIFIGVMCFCLLIFLKLKKIGCKIVVLVEFECLEAM